MSPCLDPSPAWLLRPTSSIASWSTFPDKSVQREEWLAQHPELRDVKTGPAFLEPPPRGQPLLPRAAQSNNLQERHRARTPRKTHGAGPAVTVAYPTFHPSCSSCVQPLKNALPSVTLKHLPEATEDCSGTHFSLRSCPLSKQVPSEFTMLCSTIPYREIQIGLPLSSGQSSQRSKPRIHCLKLGVISRKSSSIPAESVQHETGPCCAVHDGR